MNNEAYITDEYYRITAYDERANKSYIIDSNENFNTPKEFKKYIEDKGLIILNYTKDRYFYEGNLPKLKKLKDRIQIRAEERGIPRYITLTNDNYHDVLIALGDKYYIASYTKYYAEEDNAIVDDLVELKKYCDETDKNKNDDVDCESDCILCGEEANGYLFCKSCYYEYKNKSILVKIDKCEDFEIIDENYDKDYDDYNTSECIICGEEANGYNFCPDCYHKYKNKKIQLEIKNCNEYNIVNEEYSGPKYITKDGHIVKSKSEREIDNYLFDNDIKHAYEKEIKLKNNNGETITLHPDFVIYKNDEKIFVEFWGFNETNEKYTEIKNEKIAIYKKAGITLINVYETLDSKDIDSALEYKLNNYIKEKINFLED